MRAPHENARRRRTSTRVRVDHVRGALADQLVRSVLAVARFHVLGLAQHTTRADYVCRVEILSGAPTADRTAAGSTRPDRSRGEDWGVERAGTFLGLALGSCRAQHGAQHTACDVSRIQKHGRGPEMHRTCDLRRYTARQMAKRGHTGICIGTLRTTS
jgi:hypothetical protein